MLFWQNQTKVDNSSIFIYICDDIKYILLGFYFYFKCHLWHECYIGMADEKELKGGVYPVNSGI